MNLKEQYIVWIGGVTVASILGFSLLNKFSSPKLSIKKSDLINFERKDDDALTESDYNKKYPPAILGGRRKSRRKRIK